MRDNSKPFRVTLAWTDAPGPTSGNAFVNNLDLEVTVGGNTYKGNVFSGAFSATGGIADTRNNVESVFIPAGVTGSFVIKVKATNIAGDGVPGNADPSTRTSPSSSTTEPSRRLPVISGGATAITAESCSLPNNAIDPGETVTLNFDLTNIGTANTTNLVATMQATGGVTAPSGPQNYGVLVVNGADGHPTVHVHGGNVVRPAAHRHVAVAGRCEQPRHRHVHLADRRTWRPRDGNLFDRQHCRRQFWTARRSIFRSMSPTRAPSPTST